MFRVLSGDMTKELLPTVRDLVSASTSADLIQNREETLRKKLEVLLEMLHSRLTLHAETNCRIQQEELPLESKLDQWQEHLDYGLSVPLEQLRETAHSLNRLHQESRSRESDCWRDAVSIVRDILATWEALQAAKARSLMLDESGPNDTDHV